MGYEIRYQAEKFVSGYEGIPAIEIPELDISANIFSVIGHNGAGKSTFIKSALGLLPDLAGSLEISAGDELLVPRDHMAFCPENGAVFADISVLDYVKLWCRVKCGSGDHYKVEGKHVIDLLELEPLFPKLGRELSKGQRRRVQTAIGFLCKPKLFLFDEPFDGLDVQRTSDLADLIRSHRDEMSFVVSSHRMDVVERLSDIVLVLREGAVESVGPVSEVSRELAGTSFLITGLSEPEPVLEKLRGELRQVLVELTGSRLRVTGPRIQEEEIAKLVDNPEAQIIEVAPSLVDAMNFHLRFM